MVPNVSTQGLTAEGSEVLRQPADVFQQRDAELGIEGTIDVIDCEKGRRVRAGQQRDVEEEEKESLVGTPLVKQGVFREIAIPNPDAPLARVEILGDGETLKPVDEAQPLLDLLQTRSVLFSVQCLEMRE